MRSILSLGKLSAAVGNMTRQLYCLAWQDQKRVGIFYCGEKKDFYIVPLQQRVGWLSDTNYLWAEDNAWSQAHWTMLQLERVRGGAWAVLSLYQREVVFPSWTSSVQVSWEFAFNYGPPLFQSHLALPTGTGWEPKQESTHWAFQSPLTEEISFSSA